MNARTLISSAVALSFAALTPIFSIAQQDSPRTSGNAGAGQAAGNKLADADRQFVERAATGGVAEVEMGKLAQQKGTSDPVKQFGARMVQDHSKSNQELKQLARAKGISVPEAPTKAHHGEMDKLNKLSGADFDKQYMAHMVSDHQKNVAEFKKASESAQDGEVKAFASKTLPTLQEHLSRAQSINDSVKSASR
jgi:putative membrane protein